MPIRLVKKDILEKQIDAEVRPLKIDTDQTIVTNYEENKLVIFVKSPKWIDGEHGETESLSNYYNDVLKIAEDNRCESLALPLYFKGSCFPKELVYPTAIKAISEYLKDSELTVYLIIENTRTFQSGFALKDRLKDFLSFKYVSKAKKKQIEAWQKIGSLIPERSPRYRSPWRSRGYVKHCRRRTSTPSRILTRNRGKQRAYISERQKLLLRDELSQKPSETFSEAVLRIITEKGWKDPDCYKAANMDKRLFSKIRSNANYHPEKKTAISLAIALELNLDETNKLLKKAGYALSESDKRDVIDMFFIRQEIFNILELDGVLLENGQEMLSKYD